MYFLIDDRMKVTFKSIEWSVPVYQLLYSNPSSLSKAMKNPRIVRNMTILLIKTSAHDPHKIWNLKKKVIFVILMYIVCIFCFTDLRIRHFSNFREIKPLIRFLWKWNIEKHFFVKLIYVTHLDAFHKIIFVNTKLIK